MTTDEAIEILADAVAPMPGRTRDALFWLTRELDELREKVEVLSKVEQGWREREARLNRDRYPLGFGRTS